MDETGSRGGRRAVRRLAALAALFTGSALAARAAGAGEQAPGDLLTYTTSWIGNTFSGAETWMAHSIDGLTVTPDGTCYTCSGWEESGREAGVYADGRVAGGMSDTHGWGRRPGRVVAVSGRYVFIAMMKTGTDRGGQPRDAKNGNGRRSYPEEGRKWVAVARYLRDGKAAPFPGGQGNSGHLRALADADEKGPEDVIDGLAADERSLWAADRERDLIWKIDPETLEEVGSREVQAPTDLMLDGRGRLWVLQRPEDARPSVGYFEKETGSFGKDVVTFADGVDPRGLAWHPRRELILVPDRGPDQNVKYYSPSRSRRSPTPVVDTFGAKGGAFSRPSGRTGPRRLLNPTGAGVDAKGNLYVACSGVQRGAILRCFTPGGRRKWELTGYEFVDNADWDPASPEDVFTQEGRYRLDYRRGPGRQWTLVGHTRDPFAFPEDPRGTGAHPSAALVRRIRGRRFLVVTDMYSIWLRIFRFDRARHGEIAVPSVVVANKHLGKEGWPPHGPEGVDRLDWIWTDSDGDGRWGAGEFETGPRDNQYSFAYWIDGAGGVWRGMREKGVRYHPCEGLDGHGNPVYSLERSKWSPNPPEIGDVRRLVYDESRDALYLGGYSPDFGGEPQWWALGDRLCRYDGWLAGERRLRWKIDLPHSGEAGHIKAMSCGGSHVFLVHGVSAHVRVHSAADGSYVGRIAPDGTIGGRTGWVDITHGVNARERGGEYFIFVEDDWKSKVVMYRWRP